MRTGSSTQPTLCWSTNTAPRRFLLSGEIIPLPAALPTTENSDIVNGGAYTLQNVFNSNGLSYPGVTSDGVKIKQTMLSTTTGTQQFVFSYKANGEYEIRCKNNSNLVWTKSTGNELVLQTRTASPSSAQRWYVVKSTDGSFHLVNKAMTSRSLTVQGDSDTFETGADVVAIGTSTVGNRWRLYRDVSRVSTDYFDASFALRYEKANLPMTNAQGGIVWKDVVYNSHPARLIGDARSNATRVLAPCWGYRCDTLASSHTSPPPTPAAERGGLA